MRWMEDCSRSLWYPTMRPERQRRQGEREPLIAQYSGGVIATALAMEGVFAFFLESSFLGLFLYGEKRIGPKWHWVAAFMIFLGSWLPGYFIIVTDAWMRHPVGFEIAADGTAHLTSFWALPTNPWAFWQYLHNLGGAVITGSFVMAAVGAFYVLSGKQVEAGRLFLRAGVVAAALASMHYFRARGRELAAFLSSALYTVGMLGGAAFAQYPHLLTASTNPAHSLTIYNSRTGAYSLSVGLVWWLLGIALAIAYLVFLYSFFRGKVGLDEQEGH